MILSCRYSKNFIKSERKKSKSCNRRLFHTNRLNRCQQTAIDIAMETMTFTFIGKPKEESRLFVGNSYHYSNRYIYCRLLTSTHLFHAFQFNMKEKKKIMISSLNCFSIFFYALLFFPLVSRFIVQNFSLQFFFYDSLFSFTFNQYQFICRLTNSFSFA